MHVRQSVLVPWAVTVAMWEFIASGEPGAGSYFLSGRLLYQVYTLDSASRPVEKPPHSRKFEILVKDCTWKLRTRLDGDSDIDYFQYSFDGTNIYYTFRLVKGAHPRAAANPSVRAGLDEFLPSVIVEGGPVPRTFTSDGAEHIWLAFASGCYFSQLTNNTVLDFHVLKSRRAGMTTISRRRVGCNYVLSERPPYVPTVAEYALFDYASDGHASGTTNAMVPGARFSSGGFTNLNGIYLPTSFRYERYGRETRPNSSAPPRVALSVEGVVTSLSKDSPDWGTDIPEARVMISDQRPAGIPQPGVMYVASNGALPSLDDPGLIAMEKKVFERARLGNEARTDRSLTRKRVIGAMMIAVLAGPLAIFILRWTLVRNKNGR